MILVDSTVWIDHLRAGDNALIALLEVGAIATHPFVIGEIALGHLRQRSLVLHTLSKLPQIMVAADAEVLAFIEAQNLVGLGIGYIDAHLLAATQLIAGTALWTRDKRLHRIAATLGLAMRSHKSS